MPGTAAWFAVPAVVGQSVGFRLIENAGVSFNALDFGEGIGRIVPLGLTIAVTIGIGVWMFRTRGELQRLFVGLIFAGGLGNIVDRLANGAVTDFIDYRWFGQSLVSGNVADISITIGAIGAFGSLLFAHQRRRAGDMQPVGKAE
jgi:signal peptidase II